MQVLLASVLVITAISTQCMAQSNTEEYPSDRPSAPPTPDPLIHNLQFSLPIVIVFLLLCIMAVIVVIVVRKARYGQFCCLKPKMSFRYRNDEEEGIGNNQTEQKPPVYEVQPSISPPDYRDALQDAPTTDQAMMMEEVPMDDQEDDDQAPLNP